MLTKTYTKAIKVFQTRLRAAMLTRYRMYELCLVSKESSCFRIISSIFRKRWKLYTSKSTLLDLPVLMK